MTPAWYDRRERRKGGGEVQDVEFREKLRYLREKNGLTLEQVGNAVGVGKSTVRKWETGDIANVRRDKIDKLAAALHTSPSYLMGWADKAEPLPGPQPEGAPLSRQARQLAEDYDALDVWGRRTLRAVADAEKARVGSAKLPAIEPAPREKVIPLFGTSAAAGPGEPDTGEPWEDYRVAEDSRAEFAVRINGDSMEPELHHGDIAFCVKRRPQNGELAVLMVNGSLLCKQFITDRENIYLRSINRERRDCDYDIWASGNDTVRCYGTVLHHPVPLVRE